MRVLERVRNRTVQLVSRFEIFIRFTFLHLRASVYYSCALKVALDKINFEFKVSILTHLGHFQTLTNVKTRRPARHTRTASIQLDPSNVSADTDIIREEIAVFVSEKASVPN